MSTIKKDELHWDDWRIESLIGKGTYGKVYKVCREEYGQTYHAALKIITVPQDRTEIQRLESEGLSKTAIRQFFQAHIVRVVNEIDLMSQFAGHNYIVNFEDYQIYEKRNEVGWQIRIRMELLQSLSDYLDEHTMTTEDVLKMGIHICKALEICLQKNIIHRDIKPANIFISQQGDYKLGDFGIARHIERTMTGLSRKSTSVSMAPEVYKGGKYGASVDTYGLGIVMYSLLNMNRGPFLPRHPQAILPEHREMALKRRMKGEPVPALLKVPAELNAFIQKACAFHPEERFADPTEMRMALEAIAAKGRKSRSRQEAPSAEALMLVRPSQAVSPVQDHSQTAVLKVIDDRNMPVTPTVLSPQQVRQLKGIKRTNKGLLAFISKKKVPLLAGLVSAVAVPLIIAVAFFIASLNDRYSISINGQTEIILSEEIEAQAVLEELRAYYSDLAGSNAVTVSSVTYEEDVQVVKVNADASEVKTKEAALQDLINGQSQTLDHTAAEGETIQAVAQKYEVTAEGILAANEGLTEENPLPTGAVVKVTVAQPYLHVIVEGVCQAAEEMDFATETQEDSSLFVNTTKVQQEGEKGTKDVTYSLVLKNGIEIDRVAVGEVVTQDPVPKIVLEGTKPLRLASDNEMLQYIITRESGGNVYAVNPRGPYLGIGQLQAHHYYDYVNMSYEETLQQPDAYEVQRQAMLGYIESRYGSVGAAYEHWVAHNWY